MEVISSKLLQEFFVQIQLGNLAFQFHVLLHQLLQALDLAFLLPSPLPTPAVVGLLSDPDFVASEWRILPVRDAQPNLPQQVCNLLWRMPLASRHPKLLFITVGEFFLCPPFAEGAFSIPCR